MTKPYCTLFTGILIQSSSFSTGGNEPHVNVDDPLALDGLNRPIIKGTSLAGALIDTTRKILSTHPPEFICYPPEERQDESKNSLRPSCWRFFNAHLNKEQDLPYENRQGVKIREDTGARQGGAMFNVETLPVGTRWQFILEVDTSIAEGGEAEKLAAAALLEWQRGHCWLGRNVARGMGWFKLDQLQALRLTSDEVLQWPNSFDQHPGNTIKKLKPELNRSIAADAFINKFSINTLNKNSKPDNSWQIKKWQVSLKTGLSTNGYGFDALSVGGHEDNLFDNIWDKDHYLSAKDIKPGVSENNFNPDHTIVMTLRNDKREPFIPGSSIRGVLRHSLLRYFGESEQDLLNELFGSTETSSPLLISDALLTGEWKAIQLEHHAEDEFKGSTYGSGKFDRIALLEGEFKFTIALETQSPNDANIELLNKILELAKIGHIPLGGNQWRGLGWLTWSVDERSEFNYGSF